MKRRPVRRGGQASHSSKLFSGGLSGRDADAGALSLPLVVFAQEGLVFLALRADFGKRRFHAGDDVGSLSRGVQRAIRKREIDCESVAFHSRMLRDISVQLHEVGRIALEQLLQFCRLPLGFFIDGLAPFFIRVANCQFHDRKPFQADCGRGALRGMARKRMGKFRIAIPQGGCKLPVRVRKLNRPSAV